REVRRGRRPASPAVTLDQCPLREPRSSWWAMCETQCPMPCSPLVALAALQSMTPWWTASPWPSYDPPVVWLELADSVVLLVVVPVTGVNGSLALVLELPDPVLTVCVVEATVDAVV